MELLLFLCNQPAAACTGKRLSDAEADAEADAGAETEAGAEANADSETEAGAEADAGAESAEESMRERRKRLRISSIV